MDLRQLTIFLKKKELQNISADLAVSTLACEALYNVINHAKDVYKREMNELFSTMGELGLRSRLEQR